MPQPRAHADRLVRASRPISRYTALAAAALSMFVGRAAAQQQRLQAVSPFDVIGFLQEAKLGPATDVFAGGTVVVNGQTIVVPRNALVQMPATFLTFQELFAHAPPPYGPNQTGLALLDIPQPLSTYEIHVQGNRVGDQYIAGLITIANQSTNAGQGFINSIDYATGELRVGGILGDATTGQRVRLNDPLGRFGRVSSADPRFTCDEENPNIRTETGYPMCIPRGPTQQNVDPLCPETNRPLDPITGVYRRIYTMDPRNGSGLDPLVAAPFEVGDFVTYSGTLVKDGNEPTVGPIRSVGETYVSAWTVVANVGVFTVPGTDPVYVATDVAILGVGGAPQPGLPQEATVRTRFEGFSTDFTRPIDLAGIDMDACSGVESERAWGAINVDPGPPTGAVLGRWRFQPPTKVLALPPGGVFLPPTKEMYARSRGSADVFPAQKNGLHTGRYRAPIAEYLFPENAAVGSPPVPLNLQDFPFLAKGVGPWASGNGAILGQLDPWPGSPAPQRAACTPTQLLPPVANAGQPRTAVATTRVALDGSGSLDPNGFPLTFAWTQVAGPGVTLSGAALESPSFVAPDVPATTDLQFSLVVSDAFGTSAPSTVTVTVNPRPTTFAPPIANAGAPFTVASNALVRLDGAASGDPNVPPLDLTYSWSQIAPLQPAVALFGASTATPTFVAPVALGAPIVLSFQLTVTNSAGLGATSQVDVTVAPVAPPTANPGANQVVGSGALVTLDGTGSFDPNGTLGLPLTYAWAQVAGPVVPLSSPNAPAPTFTAPTIPQGVAAVTLAFTLTVNNGYLASDPALVQVTLVPGTDNVTIVTAIYRVAKQRLTVTAASSVPGALLTLKGDPTLQVPRPDVQFSLVGGVLTADVVGVQLPPTVTVTSSLGGSATSSSILVR